MRRKIGCTAALHAEVEIEQFLRKILRTSPLTRSRPSTQAAVVALVIGASERKERAAGEAKRSSSKASPSETSVTGGIPMLGMVHLDAFHDGRNIGKAVADAPCLGKRVSDRASGRTAIQTGTPSTSSPVTLATRVIPYSEIRGFMRAKVSSAERARTVPPRSTVVSVTEQRV